MHRQARQSVCFLALTALFLVGCGSNSRPKDFKTQASNICSQSIAQVATSPSPNSLQSFNVYISRDQSASQQALSQLEGLTPAPANAAAYKVVLTAMREKVSFISAIQKAAAHRNSQLASLLHVVLPHSVAGQQAAVKLGIIQCSSLVATPLQL